MGLFSKTVTTYASQAMSLIEDNPKFISTTIRKAILSGSDIMSSIQGALTNNIALSAKHYYTYGRDHYLYGLPTGTFVGYYVDVNAIHGVLESIEGVPVYLASATAASEPDGRFFILPWLNSVSYSWEDNSFTYLSRKCTFISAEVTADNTVTLTYQYETTSVDGAPVLITASLILSAEVAFNSLYVLAIYYLLDEAGLPTGDAKFFTYLVSSGVYPEITPTNTKAQEAPYYPVVPIRYNNTSLSNMDGYSTAKKLLKKIGVNVDDVLAGVENNPDIKDIDYAFIILGFNMDTTSSYAVEYMHNYFSFLADNSTYDKAAYTAWYDNFRDGLVNNTPPMNRLVVSDVMYKSEITYKYITKKVVSGVIGTTGTVDKEIIIRERERYYVENKGGYSFTSAFYLEDSSLFLRKQITDSSYEEIEVRGLMHTNFVNNKGRIESTLKEVVQDKDNNNFIVPLNSYIFDHTLSVTKRINLMYDCIQIIINSYEKTKLKWYQTGFFQFVILVITIALTIAGMPELGVTLQTATATEIAVMLATQLAITVAVQLAVRVAIKALGINGALATILIVVAAVATYRFTGGSGMKNMPWAKEMMSAVNTLPSAYNREVSAMTEDIMEDMAAFQQSAQTQLDEINKKLEEITKQSNLDPLGIFALMDYYPNESIDDYYYRHCHMGNPGVLTLDAITDYVDNMLNIKQ